MDTVLIVAAVWLAVAAVVAVVLGRAIHLADEAEHTDGAA